MFTVPEGEFSSKLDNMDDRDSATAVALLEMTAYRLDSARDRFLPDLSGLSQRNGTGF